MFAGWGADLFNLLAVPRAFLLLKFLWTAETLVSDLQPRKNVSVI